MTLIKKINKYWNFLEGAYPAPKYIKTVKELEFKDLKKYFYILKFMLQQISYLMLALMPHPLFFRLYY